MDENEVKERLYARKASRDTDKVVIDDDITLVVRALSRAEVTHAQKMRDNSGGGVRFENALISAALVDPVMTPEEVGQWLDGAPAGDSIKVMDVVSRLSGMDEGAPKSGL